MNTLSLLVHGGSKVGKTWLADTSPAPRLVLDAEGGNKFTHSSKIVWDPNAGPPPLYDGTWETCIVYVRSYADIQLAYQYLALGQHQFRSVTIDSLSEVQQRCVDSLVGTSAMQQQDWGELLRNVSNLVRSFRDLTTHATRPIEVVTLIAMSREVKGKWMPYMQGQIQVALPYYYDVVAYYFVQADEAGNTMRRLWVAPHPLFEAGDRTDRLPPVIDNPTIPMILNMIYPPEGVAPQQ